ncbi:asparagine--tRNA ligase [Candidatus Sumerlaeota bacterium]|nr:asparagine--tRNA ligase [Candidatus Sumerlaeota bacterium]
MNRTRIAELLRADPSDAPIRLMGWVRTRRGSKRVNFLAVNDGSCLESIQVVVGGDDVPNFDEVQRITTGCAVDVEGRLVASQGKGQSVEVQATAVRVLGWAEGEAYPLQKKGHTLEFLRQIAHLRPRTNTFGAVFRVRNALADAIHRFFQSRGFVWVHTPILTGSDCEGAGEMFHVTTHDLAGGAPYDPASDFFGKPVHLTVSGQLEGELFATALGDIYTFGPTFRAENSNTPRHLAEFWMVEPEMAFCDLAGDMDLAEDFVKAIIRDVLSGCGADLEFLQERYDKELLATLQHIVASSFERITYTEAIRLLAESGESFEYPTEWGHDLQTEHERWLTEQYFQRPVIVCDYPRDIKAFYMRQNEDGKTVAAMDVLFPRIGEIIGGSQREERLDRLQARIRELGIDEKTLWWYLETRRFGTVPHAGFGLGLERCVQFVTGMANIRDVIPFPRTPGSADF